MTKNNVSKEKLRAIIMPPESEPTIAPQRPMAFDQLTPVARLWVGYSVAVRAFSPTWEPLIPMPVPKNRQRHQPKAVFAQAYHDNANCAQRIAHRQYPERVKPVHQHAE
ncbi:Uncharacterised protein [Salmonella sp. NCTC 11881]|nr:Uncharacterised protein [Salmonella sp. NCTC 11881]